MSFPKLIIATDGNCTKALLDGIAIGSGIRRLDFSTEDSSGERRSVLRVLDLDIERAKLSANSQEFMDWLNGQQK